jgi:hypothetical protein
MTNMSEASWTDGSLILGIAYDIMELPDPPAERDMPYLRKLCTPMLIDAIWSIMYSRWKFRQEGLDRIEALRQLLQYHTIQEPTRVTSAGQVIKGAKVKPLDYFETSPFLAATHLLAPGKTRLVDGLGNEHRFPALDQRLFVPPNDTIWEAKYNKVTYWLEEIVRKFGCAWRAFEGSNDPEMNNPLHWVMEQRAVNDILDDAHAPRSREVILKKRVEARKISCMLNVRVQLYEIVRIALTEDYCRAWSMLGKLIYKLDHPDPSTRPGWPGAQLSGRFRRTIFHTDEKLLYQKPSKRDVRNPYHSRLHQGRPTEARLRNRISRVGVFNVPYADDEHGTTR